MKTRIHISIIILFVVFSYPLIGQKATESSLLEEIRQESFDLALLEEEVEYYQKLVDKKNQIKKLYEQNRLSTIREMFERDLAELEVMFEAERTEDAVNKIWEINHIYTDITELDIKNYFPEKRMLYYQARIDVMDGKYNIAKNVLEKLLTDNIDTQHRNEIVALLEEVYFNQKNYNDLISIYPVYRGINTPKQRWWLGQSMYNVGRFDEAATVFRRLTNNDEYGLRARCMNTLILYNKGETTRAINEFLTIKFRYSPETPYYNFINLSLARLYSVIGEYQEAINLYDQYIQLEEEVPDEVLYEIATVYKKFGEYSQAIEYYQMITKKAKKSKYYVAAKYFTALTEQDRGNYEQGREHLREIIDKNDKLMEALNNKYALLENYSSLLHDLITKTLNSERRTQIDNQLKSIEIQFQENRKEIETYSEGLDNDKLIYLQLLEEEYFAYTITLANFEAFVRYSKNPMISRLPSVANYQMSHTDSSIVYLQIVTYVANLNDKSEDDYILAKFMAEQKVYLDFIRNIWFDINRLGLDYDEPDISNLAEYADSLIKNNLKIIEEMEKGAFDSKLKKEEKSSLNEKRKLIKKNNDLIKDLEKEFINTFSKEITPKLSVKVDNLAKSQEDIRKKYIETITTILENIYNDKRMFEKTLIDILLRQARLYDQDFVEFRKKLTNEESK